MTLPQTDFVFMVACVVLILFALVTSGVFL